VIIGGGLDDDNAAVYQEILRGREGNGPVCILPTASGVADEALANAAEAFGKYVDSASIRKIHLTTDSAHLADSPTVSDQLRGCSGFFFTGGQQSRIPRVFRPDGRSTLAHDAVMNRFHAGAVVAGSSAGAAMMNDPMIAGGTSAAALARGVRREGGAEGAEEGSGGVNISRGMPFVTSRALMDQHFLARGRIARLIVAVLALPEYDFGFGIDENTALVVGEKEARVVGESGVVFIDARAAQKQAGAHGGTNIRVALLAAGDRVTLEHAAIRFDSVARPLRPAAETAPGPLDAPAELFNRRAFQDWITAAARSGERSATAAAEGYDLRLVKSEDFRVFEPIPSATIGSRSRPISAGPWRLDVVRR
jgi:cyanophycinase